MPGGDTASTNVRLGGRAERDGRWADAAKAYELALSLPGADPGSHARLGFVRGRLGDWRGAVAAYERASAAGAPPREHLRMANAALRLPADDPGGAAVRRRALRLALERTAVSEAARRVLTAEAGGTACRHRSRVVPGARSLVLEHIVERRGGAPLHVVQKLTEDPREAYVSRLVGQVHHGGLPAGVTTPRVLDLVEVDGVHHVFSEFVDLGARVPGGRPYARVVGVVHAHIAGMVTDPDELRALPRTDCSEEHLLRCADRLAGSAGFTAVGAHPEAAAALALVRRHAADLAAAAAAGTEVFAHNDTAPSNAAVLREDDGTVQLTLIDWGAAGRSLAGADLYMVLSNENTPLAVREHVLTGYEHAAQRYVPGVARWQLELAAALQGWIKFGNRAKGRDAGPLAARALRCGRRAVELATKA